MAGLGRNIYNLLTVLFAGAIVAAGSIAVFITTRPGDIPLSEDGFYEIYTAYDYERFWRKVESMDFIDGRLMADIYLNDLSGCESWERNPPVNQIPGPENFIGDFDGNGYSIYGLYSPKGYGLVRNNRGRIHDLTIRNSLILGYDIIGGICQWNNGAVENCVFEGELKSKEANPGEDSRMAGICAQNEGIIVKCGYRGTMTVKSKWLWEGVRAGICAQNCGQAESCYNFTRLDPYVTSAGNCYAIADAGVKGCFVRQDSCWKIPGDISGQVAQLDEETAFYLPFFVMKNFPMENLSMEKVSEWHMDGIIFPECIRQGAKISAGKRGMAENQEGADIFWQNPVSEQQLWAGNIRIEDNRILGEEALADEQMEAFVGEAFRYKGENWKDLRIETFQASEALELLPEEVETLVSSLRIMDGEQEVRIYAYALERGFASACDELLGSSKRAAADSPKLWDICKALLGLERAEGWEHDTWRLLGGSRRRPEGSFVLYLTEEGEKGFFYKKEDMLYRVSEGKTSDGEGTKEERKEEEREKIRALRDRIVSLPQTGREEREEPEGLWEALLWDMWVNRLPGDGILWRDDEVKEAVYCQAEVYGGVPSTEQITGLESLRICSHEEIKTLADLQNLPHLTGLEILAVEKVNFDLACSMTPELEELSVEGIRLGEKEAEALGEFQSLKRLRLTDCGLTDLSFLENMTGLTELVLNKNVIQDITPLSGLTGLRELDLGDNQIREIAALKGLVNLLRLNLEGNQIQDISPLAGMREMQELRLGENLIENYEALLNMTELYILAVEDNPGQEIGKAVFTPLLSGGKYHSVKEEELLQAQEYLDRFYPDQGIRAQELAGGDLNGDGIMDVAVTGVLKGEEEWQERYIYPFLGQAEGGLTPVEPLETVWIYGEDDYGDSYQGMLIAEGMLVICLEGYECDSRWSRTETYTYEDGKLSESWRVETDWFGDDVEAGFTFYNRGQGIYRDYVIARDERGYGEVMFLSEEYSLHKSDGGELRRNLEEGLREMEDKAGYILPEIYDEGLEPMLAVWDGNSCKYEIRDYPVKVSPKQALRQAAEEFLEDAAAFPVSVYTSEEIKENHDRLAGVELPEEFYIGWYENDLAMLTYQCCEPAREGGYVHSFVLRPCNEKHTGWIWGGVIYFYEETGILMLE